MSCAGAGVLECDHRAPPSGGPGGPSNAGQAHQNWTEKRDSFQQYGKDCGKCGARRIDRQIGLESTPEEWVASLVAVFDEVKRVLRKDGTLWVECGDSYNSGTSAKRQSSDVDHGAWQLGSSAGHERMNVPGMKVKDLIGQPFLLAFALREAGWYWRNVCIWHKPNPMPESVRDRFTVSHSYVLLFSKSPRYFFDAEAVREDAEFGRRDWNGGVNFKSGDIKIGHGRTLVTGGDSSAGRNARSVWTIATEPLPFEHYAAFPQALAERCIKAGTSERGCCPECGAPWVREVEVESTWADRKANGAEQGTGWTVGDARDGRSGTQRVVHGNGVSHDLTSKSRLLLDWKPGCACADGRPLVATPIPCTVLDPFLGSGTTALVARRLGRKCVGIELSTKYAELAARRTQQLSLLGEDAQATKGMAVSE